MKMRWKIALPMYNVSAAVQDGYERFAAALIERLHTDGWRDEVEVMREAVHEAGELESFWLRPDLLLSQTCGYPYATALRGRTRLLATPCYDFPGCSEADYSSALVVRAASGMHSLADARGGVAAVNDMQSNSGMNLLRHAVAPLAHKGKFFSGVKVSGSHANSLLMLSKGEADIAAIDCVTLGYVAQGHPAWLRGLTVLHHSAATPGLPFITSRAVPQDWSDRLRTALLEPDDATAAAMQALHIKRCAQCDDEDYARVLNLEQEARQACYAVLA